MIFLKQPATPFDSVDPEYELRHNDYRETGISIQDCRNYGAGFAVNVYDGEGNDFGVTTVKFVKTLAEAKKAALAHFKANR